MVRHIPGVVKEFADRLSERNLGDIGDVEGDGIGYTGYTCSYAENCTICDMKG